MAKQGRTRAKAAVPAAPDAVQAELLALTERVNAGEPVSRAEAETLVRAVGRTCEGKWREGGRETMHAARAAAVARGDDPNAEALSLRSILLTGCGQDVNELILAQPLDGKEYSAVCPKCGRTTSWRAPTIKVKG